MIEIQLRHWLVHLMDLWVDPLYRVLLVVLAVELLVLGFQVLWLVVQTLYLRRMIRLAKDFEARLEPEFHALLGDYIALERWTTRARAWPDSVLREFLERVLQDVRGPDRERVIDVYRTLGLLKRDIRQSRSWSWRARLLAMRRLSMIPDPSVQAALRERLGDIFPIRILAARALGELGDMASLVTLVQDLPLTSRSMEQPLFHVLNQLPSSVWPGLLESWSGIRSSYVRRVVLVAAATRAPEGCVRLLPIAVEDPDAEVRMGACAAASLLPNGGLEALILRLGRDPCWQVRAQAVTSFGVLDLRSAVPFLKSCCSDEAFWVRQNAAHALGRLGREGQRLLSELAQSSVDPFARDAAREEIQRRGQLEPGSPPGPPELILEGAVS